MTTIRDFNEVRERAVAEANEHGPLKLVLACAEDALSLQAVSETTKLGLTTPVLLGDQSAIEIAAEKARVDLSPFDIIHDDRPQRCVAEAANMTAQGEAVLLMKGRIGAVDFLRTALHSGTGLKSGRRLWTHIGIFWPQWLSRFLLVTDGGVVIDPSIDKIPGIIANAVSVAQRLGIEKPRVGLMAAVETVYPNMPVAMGGAIISKMAERGQIKDALVDGPLSLDVALSPEAAKEKKVGGEVAGRADILVANKIEVGNTLCKSIFIFGHAESAGLIIGPRQPIVLTSRSESPDAKINSIALAVLLAERD
jgi:phosphate butyryltransferase